MGIDVATAFTLIVPLEPLEVERRLAAIVGPVTWATRLGADRDALPLRGEVQGGHLKLRLPQRGRNSFRATVRGRLYREDAGTRIEARADAFLFVPLFLIAWELLVGRVLIDALGRADTQSAILAGLMMAFGAWLGVIGWYVRLDETRRIERIVRDALAEEALLTPDRRVQTR